MVEHEPPAGANGPPNTRHPDHVAQVHEILVGVRRTYEHPDMTFQPTSPSADHADRVTPQLRIGHRSFRQDGAYYIVVDKVLGWRLSNLRRAVVTDY